jgi:hypothetical protein
MSEEDQLTKGFVSAVMGFLVAYLVPLFFQIYAAMNAPWWAYLLLGIYVVVALGYDMIAGVANSILYTIGFILGALVLQDYLALVVVIIVLAVVLWLRRDDL